MATKWDCLFALFELKEAHLGDLAKKMGVSASSAWQKLAQLVKDGFVLHKGTLYSPNKGNAACWQAFSIMKFCKSRGINYNLFLAPSFARTLSVCMQKEEAALSDFKKSNAQTARKHLAFLSRVNLLLVVSKKPLLVKLVRDAVFGEVLSFNKMAIREKTSESAGHSPASAADYAEIEKLLAEFKALKKNISLTALEDEQRIEFTSASTQLEGNTFTLEESKELILHDVVPPDKKLKEANEVKNYYAAVNYMLSHLDEPLSIQLMLDLHKITIFNLGVKEGIRSVNVSIAGNPSYRVAHFSEILPKLDALCKKTGEFLSSKKSAVETVEFATYLHSEFQRIHPFEDGNSRVTRLLWNYALMRNGFPLINIYSNARQEYLSLTKLSQQRDDAKLNAFLARIIKDNLYRMLRQ